MEINWFQLVSSTNTVACNHAFTKHTTCVKDMKVCVSTAKTGRLWLKSTEVAPVSVHAKTF